MIDSNLAEKLTIFLSASGTGKSELIINTAKILKNAGKKVLVIDTTEKQELYNYFIFNEDIEEQGALTNLNPFTREEIDFMCNNPCSNLKINLDNLNQFDYTSYDYVLLEAEKIYNAEYFLKAKTIFLVQTFDRDKLERNKILIDELVKKERNKINFIFNKISNSISCKFNKVLIIDELCKIDKGLLWNSDEVEIEFSEDDWLAALNNKVTGNIDLHNYSIEYKRCIYDICNLIFPLEERNFKKLVV